MTSTSSVEDGDGLGPYLGALDAKLLCRGVLRQLDHTTLKLFALAGPACLQAVKDTVYWDYLHGELMPLQDFLCSMTMFEWATKPSVDETKEPLGASLDKDHVFEVSHGDDFAGPTFYTHLSLCARFNGSLEVVKHLHEEGYPFVHPTHESQDSPCVAAARCGYFDLLDYFRENGCGWTPYHVCPAWANAAWKGDVKMMKYMVENGCELADGDKIFSCAVDSGKVDALKYLLEIGCPRGAEALFNAVRDGEAGLEMIKFLREIGYPWKESIATIAATRGLPTFQYVIEDGCPWDPAQCLRLANVIHNDAVVEWINERLGRAPR